MKVIFSSSILTIAFFMVIIIACLMILDFFGANITDTNIGAGIINIALCSLFVISGLLQLRKVFKNKKLNSIEDKR